MKLRAMYRVETAGQIDFRASQKCCNAALAKDPRLIKLCAFEIPPKK
jgi:hypothetical protein